MKERIEPDLQSEVMKPETAEQLTADDGPGGRGGHRHRRGARGRPRGGQDRHRRGRRQPRVHAALVHLLRAGRQSAHRDRGDRRAHRPAQGGTVAAPIAKRCSRRCSAEAPDDRGRRQHARRRPLPDPAPDRLGRDGGRLLRRGHATSAARWRSRCCTGASPRTRSSSSASGARPASAAGLQHPNVVGVFDRGEHDGTYYIAMEYLPGRTLKEIVTAEAPLPQERVIDIGTQILAGRRLRPPPRRDPPRLQAAQRDRGRRTATSRSPTSASRAPAPRR